MQYSLRAIREIIEQPIGSPKLKYKDMSLDKNLNPQISDRVSF